VARSYDVRRFDARGTTSALAFVLASMYWRGCSRPSFLFVPPMHPPTGLVRWLATFSVVEQVDHGRQLLDLLALEEGRVFSHAHALIERMQRASAKHSPRGILLLPELLLPQPRSIHARGHDYFTRHHSNQ